MNRFQSSVLSVVLISSLVAGGFPGLTGAEEITIGTGSRAGLYYKVGRGLCRLVNDSQDKHGIICEALPSQGSIANLESIRDGRLQLGVVQSDWQYHAHSGSSRFLEAGPDQDLRALFSVHGEPFTVVARADSGIKSFADLRGKRVNIGNPGSGQRATMETVMEAFGWDKNVFSLANELPAAQQSLALCHDRVQAMIYTVGHPNPSVTQATDLCNAIIIEVSGSAIDKLVANNAFYAYTEVPGGLYAANPAPVSTFGVKATVVTSSRLNADTVYTIVKILFDRLDEFKSLHPAFAGLDAGQMISDGLSAPLHEGALRYYREQKLLSD